MSNESKSELVMLLARVLSLVFEYLMTAESIYTTLPVPRDDVAKLRVFKYGRWFWCWEKNNGVHLALHLQGHPKGTSWLGVYSCLHSVDSFGRIRECGRELIFG